jgi:hypothetical protein
VGEAGMKGKGEGGQIWLKYFIYLYQNRMFQEVGGGMKGVNLTEVHHKHTEKCHNESPCTIDIY